ncbi:hypothetical protein COLO4_07246 [Corchorus olitorius]|uniref:Retrovirus-related Pol polyprotein from transposon TNT 1-94-like beta-barrel domain-containing protein n=1 Tax=Corchorus olitorius TaxID=93759 RepID=A0A1R3KKE5_9ROSI|nr:hypothetical protein COLO4_07246 [Corchorus olitorius]
MLRLIESQDMLGFINGATPMPKSHVSKDEDAKQEKENPDYVGWRRSDRLLRGWITVTLSEEALGLVVGLETSAEVWKALVDAFAQDTQEREISLQLQLQNHTKDGSITMMDTVEAVPMAPQVMETTLKMTLKTRQAMAAMKLNAPIDSSWFPVTATSAHMTADPSILSYLSQYHGCDKILIGDGSLLDISHTGTMDIPVLDGYLQLNNVLVVPEIKKNLLSIGQLTDDYPYTCEFSSAGVVIKDRETGKMIANGSKQDGVYALGTKGKATFFSTRFKTASDEVWHQRLGHPQPKVVELLKKNKLITRTSGSPADEDTLGKPTTSTPLHVSETQSLVDVSLGASSLPNVSCATTPSYSSTPKSATDVTLINEEVHNPDPSIPVGHSQQEEAAG